jgi:hypothetical protein
LSREGRFFPTPTTVSPMTQKTNPWTFDVRVRERNLKAGSLTEKDVEKYLSQLPDAADQVEPFATAQPALDQPEIEDEADDEPASDEPAAMTNGESQTT